MGEELQAIYEKGVLRLLEPLDLPEQTPVHVMVIGSLAGAQPSPSATAEELDRQRQALDSLRARISTIPQSAATDDLSGRDHDAILYGQNQ